jgi:hypothetical protein
MFALLLLLLPPLQEINTASATLSTLIESCNTCQAHKLKH